MSEQIQKLDGGKKYKVLHGGEEIEFSTLEAAQNYSRFLTFEWAIVDESNNVVFDWVDRIGP